MLKRKFIANTGLEVSILGLGTVKFGRNTAVKYPSSFKIPEDKEIKSLLELAQELNINLLDTAPAYGNSEERLGNLLKGQRHHWVISTKVGEEFNNGVSSFDFTKEHIIKSVHRSLKLLKTDYLDILLVHSDGNDLEIINKYNIFEVLINLKTNGKIRAFGMSTKTIEGGLKTIEHTDLAMVTYTPNQQQEEKSVLDLAHKLQKGIFIKKAFNSGHIDLMPGVDPIKARMEFIYSHQAVSSIIIGTINTEHLRQNVLTAFSLKYCV